MRSKAVACSSSVWSNNFVGLAGTRKEKRMRNLQKTDFQVVENEIGFVLLCKEKMIYCGTEDQCEEELHNAWDEYIDGIVEEQASAQYERDFY